MRFLKLLPHVLHRKASSISLFTVFLLSLTSVSHVCDCFGFLAASCEDSLIFIMEVDDVDVDAASALVSILASSFALNIERICVGYDNK